MARSGALQAVAQRQSGAARNVGGERASATAMSVMFMQVSNAHFARPWVGHTLME